MVDRDEHAPWCASVSDHRNPEDLNPVVEVRRARAFLGAGREMKDVLDVGLFRYS